MADTVCDHIVSILEAWGVDTVFGLPGNGINGLVEAFRKAREIEVNRRPIGLTIGRHAVQEFDFSASPFGIGGRAVDKLTGRD